MIRHLTRNGRQNRSCSRRVDGLSALTLPVVSVACWTFSNPVRISLFKSTKRSKHSMILAWCDGSDG